MADELSTAPQPYTMIATRRALRTFILAAIAAYLRYLWWASSCQGSNEATHDLYYQIVGDHAVYGTWLADSTLYLSYASDQIYRLSAAVGGSGVDMEISSDLRSLWLEVLSESWRTQDTRQTIEDLYAIIKDYAPSRQRLESQPSSANYVHVPEALSELMPGYPTFSFLKQRHCPAPSAKRRLDAIRRTRGDYMAEIERISAQMLQVNNSVQKAITRIGALTDLFHGPATLALKQCPLRIVWHWLRRKSPPVQSHLMRQLSLVQKELRQIKNRLRWQAVVPSAHLIDGSVVERFN